MRVSLLPSRLIQYTLHLPSSICVRAKLYVHHTAQEDNYCLMCEANGQAVHVALIMESFAFIDYSVPSSCSWSEASV